MHQLKMMEYDYTKQQSDKAKLILSILQALGKIDTSIILHSLIAKLHCIAIWRKMKEVENG